MKVKIFLIGLIIGIFATVSYAKDPITYYKVRQVVKVVDGDTVDLIVEQGFGVLSEIRVRMDKYDAPETWRPGSIEERTAGLKVKNYLTELLTGKTIWLVSIGPEEIYSRWPGVLWDNTDGTGPSINDKVIAYMVANNLTKDRFGK